MSFGELLAVFSACYPAPVAVLRLVVGAESVRLPSALVELREVGSN